MAVTAYDETIWTAMRRARRRLRIATRRAIEINRTRRKAFDVFDDDPYRAFVEAYRSELTAAYNVAWSEGSAKAGRRSSQEAAKLAAEIEYSNDEPYVLRFANDAVFGDTYIEGEGFDWPFARTELYIKRIRGVGNRAFVEYSPADMKIEWVLGDAEHCDDCPRLASDGPYYPQELAHVPADGSTDCLGQCRCTLVRQDGAEGLLPEPRAERGDEEE